MSAIISPCGQYRYRLERTVAMEVIIAFFGYPVARITLFSPIIVYVIGVPNKITCIKLRA